jgi:hypothetical protein
MIRKRLYGIVRSQSPIPRHDARRFASAEYHAFWEGKYMEAFSGGPLGSRPTSAIKGRRVCNEIFLSPVFDTGRIGEGGLRRWATEITRKKEADDLVREQAAGVLRPFLENSANMMIWTLDRDISDHLVQRSFPPRPTAAALGPGPETWATRS